jgi:protein-disulfide isomerase
MSEETEKSITIKKSDLWKYSTFLLLILVLVGVIFLFKGNGTGSAVQQQNTGATQQQGVVDLSVFTDNPDLYPALGPADSKNVVLEFSDFQCPWCATASGLPTWVNDAAKTNPQVASVLGSAGKVEEMAKQGKLRFVYVPMSFLGPESGYAAEAGYCANEQGKFWDIHDAIFTAQTQGENTGKFNKDKLEIIAQGISGLDQSKFKNCLETGKYASDVQTAGNQASTAASGTPTFYVNGAKTQPVWSQISAALV